MLWKIIVCVVVVCWSLPVHAVVANTNLDVAITVSIDVNTVRIVWDSDQTTTNRAWNLADVSLASSYTTAAEGVDLDVRNQSNAPVDISAHIANQGSQWTAAASAGSDVFSIDFATVSDSTTGTDYDGNTLPTSTPGTPNIADELAIGSTQALELRFATPTAISAGKSDNGTVTVRLTGSLD